MSAAAAAAVAATPAQHLPPTAVPFIVPAAFKRVRTIDAEGQEEHADDNPWVHMQLKDPFQQQQSAQVASNPAAAAAAAAGQDGQAVGAAVDAAAEAGRPEEAAPKPEEVMRAFASAKGELEWLQATLATLQEGRYLTVGRVEKPVGPQRLMDLASGANSRYQRRSAAAAAAAAALSEGAAALAALGSKEDAFYGQVAQLQRYWKVQTEPPDSAYAYSVNLRLTSSSASSSSDGSSSVSDAEPASMEAAAAVGRGATPMVYLLKDPSGMLRVQVPAPKEQTAPSVTRKGVEELPAVYTGPAAIHGLLLQQLRLNAWHLVLSSLDAEITHMLGLPARLQPSAAAARAASAAAAAGGRSGSVPQQLQKQCTAASVDISAAAGAAASDALPSSSTGTGTTTAAAAAAVAAAAPPVGRSGSSSSALQRQLLASSAGGHFSFYATLSSLVLQAVIGSAATAGEDSVLQQQQQEASAAATAAAAADGVGTIPSRGATPAADGSMADGLLLGEIDVGGPWERAAAAAAAAAGGGHLLPQDVAAADAGAQAAAAAAAAKAAGVTVDPKLLSLRPLALGHLLVTQLGHLLTFPWRSGDATHMAAAAYAFHARQAHERQRQRFEAQRQQQQQQGLAAAASSAAAAAGKVGTAASAAAAAGSISGGGGAGRAAVGAAAGAAAAAGVVLLPQVSFMTCLSRWLAHSSSRELLRGKLDEQLVQHPGVAAKTLQCCHSCVSVIRLAPSLLPAAPAVRSSCGQQQQGSGLNVKFEPELKPDLDSGSVLVLLSDTSMSLEGPGLGVLSGDRGLLGQHSRARDVSQVVTYLHALPGLLQPLLQQMDGSGSSCQQG